jgi:RHS repeat-associated protein
MHVISTVCTGCETGTFGYDTPLVGMPYEERVYSSGSTDVLRSRKITSWTSTQLPITSIAGSSVTMTAGWHPRVTKEETIIYDPATGSALSTSTTTDYDGDLNQITTPVNAKTVKQYGFTTTLGSLGALQRSSETTYLSDVNYTAINLRSLPTQIQTKNSGGSVVAQTQVFYDESGYGSGGVRGQVTRSRSWSDIANNLYIDTRAKYDSYGNLVEATDARGNITSTAYDSTYHAYPVSVTSPIPDPSGVNGSSTAFTTSTTYDTTTGLPLTATDANGQTSTMEYNDPLLRPTRIIAPNGQQTTTEYGAGTSSTTRYVKVSTQIDATNWSEETTFFDGIGRDVETQEKDSQGDIFTDVVYDNMGRVWQTTNPYRLGETVYWNEKQYDDLGRLKASITPDGAQMLTAFGLASSGSQMGTTVTVTDEAGKKRRSVTDALGRLIRVDEPNDGGNLGAVDNPVQPTVYTYDVLDNLAQINQGGQTRTFSYDSLERLKSATNPESGFVTYQYDADSNVTEKKDARNITTTIAYDALNRPKSKVYSDSTPTISYYYDDSNVPYSKGKLTKIGNAASITEYTLFDNDGNILTSNQTTDGHTYSISYSYNLSGNLLNETYPSGRVVQNTFDADGSLSQVQSKKATTSFSTYADTFSYTSAGKVSSVRLGNGLWESNAFNSRLQPTQIALGSALNGTDLLKLNFDYGSTTNNGNVLSQTITVPSVGGSAGFTAVQNYTYDSLNRLKSATETIGGAQSWKQTFLYDRFGNRTFDLANTTIPNTALNPATSNPQIDQANNRFQTSQGYLYDFSGNLIQDAEGKKYLFNGENKQTEVQYAANSQQIASYLYDGDGHRVKKTVADTGEQTVFVYDACGQLIEEYSNNALQTGYIYAGDRLLATETSTGTTYLTSDELGTPRIKTDQSGNVVNRNDYLPFGEDIFAGIGSRSTALKYDVDNVRQKFTGKIRDTETGLDYFEARYYASKWGRFTNPDEFTGGPEELVEFDGMIGHNPTFYAELGDPQSLNKYQYCLNNPLRYIDPDGHQTTTTDRVVPLPWWMTWNQQQVDWIVNTVKDNVNRTVEGAKQFGKEIVDGFQAGTEAVGRSASDNACGAQGYICPPVRMNNAANNQSSGSENNEAPKPRGSRNPNTAKAAAEGRKQHKNFADKVKNKSGWKSEPSLKDPETGKTVKPDAVTRGGRPLELKPKTPSGRKKGERQIKPQERATGKKGRVVYYEPKP